MPLRDDPALLRGPLRFAARISEDDEFDVDAARQRLPGLLKFARTFFGELLEKEFATTLTGFPVPARGRAAALTARLKRERDATVAGRRLVMTVIDLCDLEIDRNETSGDDDDDDAYFDDILDLIQRLLDRFAEWVDPRRLPRLAGEAERAQCEFRAASEKLRS